jgi:integrase
MTEAHSTSAIVRSKPATRRKKGRRRAASPAASGPDYASTTPAKPAKPYAEFPLFAHATGYWAKKIRGRLIYFGPWDDPDGALDKYLKQKETLHAGKKPREETTGLTLKELVNHFLNAKQAAVDNRELSPRTHKGYEEACLALAKSIGKTRLVEDLDPDDFAKFRNQIAKRWGPHRVGTVIQCVRCLFGFGLDSGLFDRPVRYGPQFKRPTAKTMRKHRAAQGAKLFTADEIHKLLAIAGPAMRAMILLGANCGLGNSDCGCLPLSALDLDHAILDFARPKTGIKRRAILWPETVQAIQEALAKRPEAKDPADADLVFITRYGESWSKDVADSPVSKEMRKLMNKAGINGHRNFYCLRHTYRTVADGAKDQPAADYTMGHEAPHMSTHYREAIEDDRLRAVSEHVRRWLFAEAKKDDAQAQQAASNVE